MRPRQHETQRERMTNLIIVIGAGSLALATTRVEGISLSLLGLVLIVLGLYGAVFSLKHYERNRRHVAMLKAIGKKRLELYPQTELDKIRRQAKTLHSASFWLVERLPVHYLWIGLPLMVSILGVVLVFSK